jgi:N-acetylmuramoyl-L-alanine amidase
MLKSKKLKTILLSLGLSLLFVTPAKAATYKVTSGDTLYKIGQLFNVSTTTIIKNNNLSNTTIYPNENLNIPASSYTVQKGDSLFLIGKKFQVPVISIKKINNLIADTIFIGQKLNMPNSISTTTSTVATSSNLNYSQSDVDLLARLINAEAGGEPYNAKVEVGAVVLNRLKDSRFPKSISAVIYEKNGPYYQFTPVLNGYINNPASADSVTAAYAALKGTDPTNGALYYFDDSTTNAWLWSKPVSIIIDKMVFSYY